MKLLLWELDIPAEVWLSWVMNLSISQLVKKLKLLAQFVRS